MTCVRVVRRAGPRRRVPLRSRSPWNRVDTVGVSPSMRGGAKKHKRKLTLGNSQFLQCGDDLVRVLSGVDFLLDVFDCSILADVESPAFRDSPLVVDDAVGFGDVLFRVA